MCKKNVNDKINEILEKSEKLDDLTDIFEKNIFCEIIKFDNYGKNV